MEDLKCIKVTRSSNYGATSVSYISWNRFERSFVAERWNNERRYHKVITIFGPAYLLNVNKSPDGQLICRRRFDFPASVDQAKALDKQHGND